MFDHCPLPILSERSLGLTISCINQHPLSFARQHQFQLCASAMGHKHSSLHRQLKQQDVPSHDLVSATDSAGGGGTAAANSSSYFEVKQGPFRRKLSVRNISIRRSFHISKKSHTRLNKVSAATTDDLPKLSSTSSSAPVSSSLNPPSSSHAVANGASVPTDLVCNNAQTPSPSTPTPVSLPRAASVNRNGDKYGKPSEIVLVWCHLCHSHTCPTHAGTDPRFITSLTPICPTIACTCFTLCTLTRVRHSPADVHSKVHDRHTRLSAMSCCHIYIPAAVLIS